MRAVRFEVVGDPSVLKVVEAPAPAVNEGTALVRVMATNKIRSGRPTTRVRSAAEQPRFRGSNRMLPKNGGRSHPYAPENTRPKMRPEQDQGGSVHGRIAGGRIVVVRRRQSPKRRRASWQASSPGKHTRQTCGLSA